MTPIASAAAGLRGALLLARGRAEGAALVEPGANGALHSFWAMAACLLILGLLALVGDVGFGPSNLAAYGVGWLGFAVLSHRIAGALGAGDRWIGFITVWNWCSVVQQALGATGSLPGLLGAPASLAFAAMLIVTGWAVWLEWYATRVTLGVSGLAAAGFVLLDYAISLTALEIGSAVNGSAG